MPPIRTLLSSTIDYAGLFPPAGLAMRPALENYAAYRAGPQAWALGRFVVPASRLGELEDAVDGLLPPQSAAAPWRLAVLLGGDLTAEVRGLGELNCRHAASGAGGLITDVVELRAESPEAVEGALARLPDHLQAYVEVPVDRDPTSAIGAIARHSARAKVRTGGVTPDAFPSAPDLVRFIRACRAAGVPFKATAGLHHPLRASYPLTYAPDSARAPMYGFLNLYLAAAWLRAGLAPEDAIRLLKEEERDAIRFDPAGVEWRGHRLEEAALRSEREHGIASFGSCSFTEPLGDLESLGLL